MKKLALFGTGDIAHQLLELLGSDLVEFCFCNNRQKSEICGKPVLCYDDFLKRRDEVTVIVASTKYAEEMSLQLDNSGINEYFVWDNNTHHLLVELAAENPRYIPLYCGKSWENLQFSPVRSFYHFDILPYKSILVYTYPEISDIILRLLRSVGKENNVTCVIHPNEAEKKTFEVIKDRVDCVLCSVKREDNAICDEYEFTLGLDYIDLYDIAPFIPEFHSTKARKYKNKYIGKRCFIIGNGPSLNSNDLDKLEENGELTFASNKIYNIFDKTKWRPDFYFVTDVWLFKSNTRDILNVVPKQCSFYNYAFCNGHILWIDTDEIVPIYNTVEQADDHHLTRFSKDISIYHANGWSVTYSMIQAAYYMGFEEVYLIGCDHFTKSLEITKKTEHFYDSGKELLWDILPDYTKVNNHIKMNNSYKAARLVFETSGRKIFNATRGGYLDVFERVDFDELFKEDTE